jgi:hypothetical protein
LTERKKYVLIGFKGEENMKKLMPCLFVFLLFVTKASSGEWDYVPNVSLRYIGNQNEEMFRETVSRVRDGPGVNFCYPLSKLPKEVNQAIWSELNSYDLDAGDVFMFSCGYERTTPKAIFVFLRITRINRDGTCNWVFYAWQVR